jgi:hypothetical protein
VTSSPAKSASASTHAAIIVLPGLYLYLGVHEQLRNLSLLREEKRVDCRLDPSKSPKEPESGNLAVLIYMTGDSITRD